MSPATEKRLLQTTVGISCLVPIAAGTAGVLLGPAFLAGVEAPAPRDLDSHFRYLSGIFLVLGLGFASCVPGIEARSARFRLLGSMVILGGLARALSAFQFGLPSEGHRLGLVMELGVTPLLILWQARVAKRLGEP